MAKPKEMCVPKALRVASALSSADPLPPLPWRISLGLIWDVTPLLQFPSFWGAGRFSPGWERFNNITGGVLVPPEGTDRQLVPHARRASFHEQSWQECHFTSVS